MNFFEECGMLTEDKKIGIVGKLEEIFGIINGRIRVSNKRGRDSGEHGSSSDNSKVSKLKTHTILVYNL